jgi:metal-responsive CopG/Arc/MetJ family transcriptional regulator
MFEARSTTAKIRFPKEFLAVLDEYAAVHNMARSMAVRALIMRGLAWEDAKEQTEHSGTLARALDPFGAYRLS